MQSPANLKIDLKGVQLIILFGSHAEGRPRQRSDVDIAVLADHPLSLEEKMVIGETVAHELQVYEDDLDVVDLWQAAPLLQYQIARSGKLLMGDTFDFIRFRVRATKRYYDTAKFRRAREQALKRYVERSGAEKT